MINKKYVFIILFISILSISAAYASENITQDVVSVELDDSIEISNDEGSNLMQIPETENTQTIDETENNLTANNEKEIIANDENSNLMQIPESENAQTIYETENNLTANNEKEIASLSYLKYLISTPPQSNEIILDNDFIYTEEFDANLTDIDLNCENIVIDGNNHVINGLNKITFTVSANNVTLKNIKFINCAKENTKIVIGATITRQAIDTEAGEKGGMLYATLTDNNGKPLINKNVQIVYNGKIYNRTTDNQGRAGMKISFTTPSTYTYVFAFQGDNNYNAAPLAVTQLKIIQKKTTISAVSKAFTLKAKKTISVTLKTVQNEYDKKTYLNAGKPITLKINGKTYTAKINKNGVAKFSVTLVKKGKYTAAIKFAGDQLYKASSKSIKITII